MPAPPTEAEIDANNRYEVKVPLKAGLRTIGVSFPKKLALEESLVPKIHYRARARAKPATVTQMPMDVQVDGAAGEDPARCPPSPTAPTSPRPSILRDVMQISVRRPL